MTKNMGRKTDCVKSVSWIKIPVRLLDDGRVRRLVMEKGTTGLGVYMSILIEMYRNTWRCLSEKNIRNLKFVGATQKTIRTVLEDYDLFQKNERGNWTTKENFLEYKYIDEEFKDEKENKEESEGNSKSDCKSDYQSDYKSNYKSDSKLMRARYIETETETDYHHLDGDDDHVEAEVVKKDDWISQIPRESEWTEVAMMRSRFGPLIMRNWWLALEEFRKHVIANCSAERIRSVEDAKRYFLYYVTNPTSGTLLRKALEEHERRNPTQNVYRYEDPGSGPGKRRYNGIPLPDDAPPRPGERSDWDYVTHSWIII